MADINGFPQPEGPKTPPRFTRRGFLLGGVAALTLGGVLAGRWFNVTASAGTKGTLSAPDAHARALDGSVTLVDIRRPDEWNRTGVPEGAVALDMRRPDFAQTLQAQVGGDKTAPIALICARGVRSRGMAARLRQAGFTQIIDVSEGMSGSGAGAGWVKRGLPVVRP